MPATPNGDSSSVLSDAYPSKGSSQRPGSASKSRHGRQSMVAAYGTSDKSPSIHFLAAALSLAALAGHSLTEGWVAASGVVSNKQAVSYVAVPIYLTGILKGAAAGILTGVFCKRNAMQAGTVAAIVVMSTPMAALVSLAQVPLGSKAVQHSTFMLYGQGVISKWIAGVAGALLFLSLSVLTQIASRVNQAASVKGLLAGVACAGLVFAVRGLLCATSPYCMKIDGTVFILPADV